MFNRLISYSLFIIFLAVLLNHTTARANDHEKEQLVSIRGDFQNNLYRSGEIIDANFNSTDDIFIAGGEINYHAQTTKNTFLAGGNIKVIESQSLLSAISGGSLYLSKVNFQELLIAGGNVQLDSGIISDDLVAAGGNVIVGKNFRVKDSAMLSGGNIIIEGHIAGDVQVYARKLEIKAGAIIDKNLSYRADEVIIDPNAQIGGEKISLGVFDSELSEGTKAFSIFAFIVMSFSMLMIPSTMSLIFKPTVITGSKEIYDNIWPVLGKGVVIALAIPLLLITLFVSIIGIPFAFVLIPFLIIGFILADSIFAFTVGHFLYIRINKLDVNAIPGTLGIVGWTLLGTVITMLVLSIPFLGFFLFLFATFLSLGALYQAITIQSK